MSEVVEGIMGYSGMDGVRVVEIEEVIQNCGFGWPGPK